MLVLTQRSGEAAMSEFKTVARVGDIRDGGGACYVVGQKVVAVFRRGDRYDAINDCCPHMGASLAEGHLDGDVVSCPWHAWRFRVTDGTWCDNPRIKTEAYEVRILGDQIQVRITGSGQGTGRISQASEQQAG
jgi:nitrite reductase (NADH) small subunit/3-phenylpropionate/trans-cinnamate dioxygenase ferredoxin subunit